ncbi:MAG: hypothetical protein B0D91_11735 [Oceanospirillales bacterium LUC14_002_19_P2]|nr:MAG: hypothetical protein B0D91_11735 [Oceanospirillales bacterium LUC14_002_19_P2]
MGNSAKHYLIVASIALSLSLPALPDNAIIKRLVIFGDSLSDQGNLFELFHERIPVSPPYWQGRFSNGPVWTDILSLHYTIKNMSQGGATLVNYRKYSVALQYLYVTYLGEEVSQFLKNDQFLPTDLIIIWMGGNDYATFKWVSPRDRHRAVRELYIEILRMRHKGAQHILVINLPDIAETPRVKEDDAELFHRITLDHNHQLEVTLSSKLPPDVLRIFDAYTTFKAIFSAPETYGLNNTSNPCYSGSIWRHHQGISADHSDDPVSWLHSQLAPIHFTEHAHFRDISTCQQHLFFDDLHPTTFAHGIIADKLDQFIQKNYQPVLIQP